METNGQCSVSTITGPNARGIRFLVYIFYLVGIRELIIIISVIANVFRVFIICQILFLACYIDFFLLIIFTNFMT